MQGINSGWEQRDEPQSKTSAKLTIFKVRIQKVNFNQVKIYINKKFKVISIALVKKDTLWNR